MNLAAHYSRFRVSERLLLTGHSHQAWPDIAFEAQQQAWLEAAALVDDKWSRAAQKAEDVRCHWRRLLGDQTGHIALGQNTHELVTRFLSGVLPIFAPAQSRSLHSRTADRRGVVTTDGEFHTIRRQLDRLVEEGIEVIKEPAHPVDTLAERLVQRVNDRTACVLVSSVLFETAEIVPNLGAVASACTLRGAELLIDAYHHMNVVPFELSSLQTAFVVGGGYKYCQLGEGNGFLRFPEGCTLRPVLTGWFSEFDDLGTAGSSGDVRYADGHARFAGATYDPTAHYRAAAVFDFHVQHGLTPTALREVSQTQTSLLAQSFLALDNDPRRAALVPMSPDRRAGFVAIRSPHANEIVRQLRPCGMFADARGQTLRLGPAPYLTHTQLSDAVALLGEIIEKQPRNYDAHQETHGG